MLLQLRYVTQRYSDKIYDRLQVIFKKCNNQLKREIIASADIIVNSDKHDDFAQLLLQVFLLLLYILFLLIKLALIFLFLHLL